MTSRKRNFSLFSLDDGDFEYDTQVVREEQLTYGSSRSRKKIYLSTVDINCLTPYHNTENILISPSASRNQMTIGETAGDSFSYSYTLPEAEEHAVDNDFEAEDEEFLNEDNDEIEDDDTESSKRIRYKSLDDFRELKSEFLQQFMQMLFPDTDVTKCSVCMETCASLHCLDCFHFRIQCQNCVLKEHSYRPLHRLQYFDGFTWQRVSLRSLGLKVHLGHEGRVCPALRTKDFSSLSKTMTIIDIKGIQEVEVLFCACEKLYGVDSTERSQLIRHGWFPATTECPKTVATFNTLDIFGALSGEAKLSGYHFYRSLVRLRDGPGCENIPKRYEEFMRMTREYQHLKMIQRAGKMCDPEKALDIKDGELAVECPACPHPNKNIPEDWDKKVNSWIYTLFIMIDANFRLKSKKKRTVNDSDLQSGCSYFVNDIPYKDYLKSTVEEKEINCCDSGLRAIDHASLKGGRGYDASGVVGVQCRHMLIRPNGIGDLQKGEKYANVDYVVLSSLKDVDLKRITLSYDINCQYSRNFAVRMSRQDTSLQLDLNKVALSFVIPQFHIAGHGAKCRTTYNLRYREHVGRTDGENIERGWAALNPLSMASKEMGKGSRHDYLDWHIGDWNYQRIPTFGRLLSKKLTEAANESVKHTSAMVELRNAFPKGAVKEMEDNIRQWNEDPLNNPNPYAERIRGVSMLKVRHSLAETEAKEENGGVLSSESVSATHWLAVGLELEDGQVRTKKMYKSHKGDNVKTASTTAVEKNAGNLRKIRAWKNKQLLHMPRLSESDLWDSMQDIEKNSLRCWTINLNLPSSLSRADRNYICSSGLVYKEIKLREAQALDSLEEIRLLLQKQWWLTNKKKQHVCGQGQKRLTKSNNGLDLLRDEREKFVDRYRRARAALLALQPEGEWQSYLKELANEDIRPMEDDEGKGEGRRTLSWIWMAEGAAPLGQDDKDIYEGLKVEYAKARARANRWLEEVHLVQEEMRRILAYINWKIGWWLDSLSQLKDRRDKLALGCVIYGNRQVCILRALAQKFRQRWEADCNIKSLPALRNDGLLAVKTIDRLPIIEYCD